jgi:hypothetical protein
LKLGEFRPGDKGQMELYLGWLNRYERKQGEEAPLGLILCAGKRHETVELLDLERSGIKVSSYWTEALPKAGLERKLHEAVILARARLEGRIPEHGPVGSGGEESRFIKESRAVYRTIPKRGISSRKTCITI